MEPLIAAAPRPSLSPPRWAHPSSEHLTGVCSTGEDGPQHTMRGPQPALCRSPLRVCGNRCGSGRVAYVRSAPNTIHYTTAILMLMAVTATLRPVGLARAHEEDAIWPQEGGAVMGGFSH